MGGDTAPEGYETTEVGSDDEDAAMVESYAFAETVHDGLFGSGAARSRQPPSQNHLVSSSLLRLHVLTKSQGPRKTNFVPKPSPRNI